ncbi:hypothetical protein EDB96_1745 [Flavobacterium sp. S87F.05.LMB.W.Kidney.N]|nr:hypothetical protein EDB96_1745 [Flavobacterium sp. S87F.05.LMB.W.Kidney.N]
MLNLYQRHSFFNKVLILTCLENVIHKYIYSKILFLTSLL